MHLQFGFSGYKVWYNFSVHPESPPVLPKSPSSSLMCAVHAKEDKASSSDQYRLPSYSSWLGMIASEVTDDHILQGIKRIKYFCSNHLVPLVRLKTQSDCVFFSWLIVQVYCKVKITACVRKHRSVIVDVHSHTDRFWLRKAKKSVSLYGLRNFN